MVMRKKQMVIPLFDSHTGVHSCLSVTTDGHMFFAFIY